ncbi:hypothetical protein LINPERHAP2_LOCUS35052, partial [Linum perenne]
FYRSWSKALVVKVLERSFSFGAVKRRLETLWARNGEIQVSDASNSFFLVRFADSNDYQRAAFQGPWKIFDYYFSVARWSPYFNEEEPLKTLLMWVRLPKLPIHFFNQVAITRIGDCIGRTVRLDLATSEGARGHYARVCVEIDLSKPLLGKYMIDDRTYLVEYESLENICFTCGFYGHKTNSCQIDHQHIPTADEPEVELSTDNAIPTGEAGEWMTVQRRSKTKGKKASNPPPNDLTIGSRFKVLSKPSTKDDPESDMAQKKGNGKEEDTDVLTSKLASQLAEVLANAPCMQKVMVDTVKTPKAKSTPRQPLKNISNVYKKSAEQITTRGLSQTDMEQSTELVTVPVVYDNPTFQGVSQTTKLTRGKKPATKHDKGTTRRENHQPTTGREENWEANSIVCVTTFGQ